MKIVPKAQYGRPLVAQSDNTRVAKPIIERKIQYKLKPGELFFTDRNTGKKILIKPRNETISADRRNTYQKKQDEKRTQQLHRQYEEDKKQEEGMKNLQGFLTFVSPSTYIGPVFNNNGKSYTENVMSGEGTGDVAGNVAIDILTPFAIGGAGRAATNVAKRFPYRLNIPVSSDKYYRVVGMDAIDDANKSGLIRWQSTSNNTLQDNNLSGKSLLDKLDIGSRSGGVPYFTKGKLYMPPESGQAVIIGNNSIPWRRIGPKGKVNKYSPEDPINKGNSATPYINGQFNIAPAENFEYWTRGSNLITKHLFKRRQFKSPTLSTKNYIYHDRSGNIIDNSGFYHFQRLLNGGYQKVKQQGDIVSDFPVRIYHIPSQRSNAYETILNRTNGKVSSEEVNQILDDVFYGTSVDFNNKPLGIVLTDNPNLSSSIVSHELDHAIHIPSEFPKGFNRNIPDYLLENNGSELAARGSQLKDYFKITDPNQPITEDMLRYASKNYIKDTGIDNNMAELFNSIIDWKEAAKWLSKYSTVISVPILSRKDY